MKTNADRAGLQPASAEFRKANLASIDWQRAIQFVSKTINAPVSLPSPDYNPSKRPRKCTSKCWPERVEEGEHNKTQSNLSSEDRKSRANSPRNRINSFKATSLYYSKCPSRFIYEKSRLVSGAFAQNVISLHDSRTPSRCTAYRSSTIWITVRHINLTYFLAGDLCLLTRRRARVLEVSIHFVSLQGDFQVDFR